ncbi:hypothetical protein J3458_004662 [Metarhizium acridum]|uniref:uncharacterized protein n=1 Tax=Metarhizium acridum TaxID=92637 RepID=UPI001C6C3DCB|nr:hypothetical protein J3458_004662 [Metarhizium acridum]
MLVAWDLMLYNMLQLPHPRVSEKAAASYLSMYCRVGDECPQNLGQGNLDRTHYGVEYNVMGCVPVFFPMTPPSHHFGDWPDIAMRKESRPSCTARRRLVQQALPAKNSPETKSGPD